MAHGAPPNASGLLDRDAATRADIERLRSAWAEPGARLLRLRGAEVPVRETSGGPRLALVPVRGAFEPSAGEGRVRHVYLGRTAGDRAPVFAEELPEPAPVAPDARAGREPSEPEGDGLGGRAPGGERWVHPFAVGEVLPEAERELVAVASALLRWHEAARFSPLDGGPTRPALGGWARRDAHGGEHFPRTDPAVIVLIEHEGRILLGSNALWEAGRFSLLAGFVEAGESLEQAVAREVLEESGARLDGIRYVASQPWPFPRSLMLGFRARLADGADPEDLRPDPEEISELRWFTREELRGGAAGITGITLPRPLSIARWMIDGWIAEGDPAGGR